MFKKSAVILKSNHYRAAVISGVLLFACGCNEEAQDLQNSAPLSRIIFPLAAAQSKSAPKPKEERPVHISTIIAQGRIMPSSGVIAINAIPGDRIEELLVRPNQMITKSQLLVRMQSENARRQEIKTLKVRLDESQALKDSKKLEGDLNVTAAQLKLDLAKQQVQFAKSQLDNIRIGKSQLADLRAQVETFELVRNDPLTKSLVSEVELQARHIEVDKAESTYRTTLLAAEQGVAAALSANEAAEGSLEAAKKGSTLLESGVPLESLKQQIASLEEQIQISTIKSPIDGTVLSINGQVGELASPTPILQVGDLTSLVVQAEVHEADTARLQVGQRAEIESAALPKLIHGTVQRVDTMVGLPQMRSMNPMSRTDFRAMPVWIEIDAEDVAIAKDRIQLQVDVRIDTGN